MQQKNALAEPAYDLTVQEDHCFFVKGFDGRAYLVSNSSHAAKAFSVLGYYAPELKGGVQPPKRIVKDLFGRPSREYSAEGAGWMR